MFVHNQPEKPLHYNLLKALAVGPVHARSSLVPLALHICTDWHQDRGLHIGYLFGAVVWQACLPVKDLDLGYNLVTTHDGKGAFVIVDHDELDPRAALAPMSFVYSAGQHCKSCVPLVPV